MVAIERFELSQTIAMSCGVNKSTSTLGVPAQADKAVCGWDVGGFVIWTDAMQSCTEVMPENAEFNGMCYNNPNGNVTIFAS